MRVQEDPKTVIGAVKQRLVDLAPTLAREQLSVVSFYDRSQLIRETTETVTNTLLEAIITTVIVVVAFLLHVRASLAVAVSLPLGHQCTLHGERLPVRNTPEPANIKESIHEALIDVSVARGRARWEQARR